MNNFNINMGNNAKENSPLDGLAGEVSESEARLILEPKFFDFWKYCQDCKDRYDADTQERNNYIIYLSTAINMFIRAFAGGAKLQTIKALATLQDFRKWFNVARQNFDIYMMMHGALPFQTISRLLNPTDSLYEDTEKEYYGYKDSDLKIVANFMKATLRKTIYSAKKLANQDWNLKERYILAQQTLSEIAENSKEQFIAGFQAANSSNLVTWATESVAEISNYLDQVSRIRPDVDVSTYRKVLRDVMGAFAYMELIYKNNDTRTWCQSLIYIVSVLSDYDLVTITDFMNSSVVDLATAKYQNEAVDDKLELLTFESFIKGGKAVFNTFSPSGLIGKIVEFATRCALLFTGLCKTYDDLKNFDIEAVIQSIYENGDRAMSILEVIGEAAIYIVKNFHKLFKGDLSWLKFSFEEFNQLENRSSIVHDIVMRLEKFGELKALGESDFKTIYELKDEAVNIETTFSKKIEREKSSITRTHLMKVLDSVKTDLRRIDEYLDDAGVFVQPSGVYFVGPPGTGKTYASNEVTMKLNAIWTGERNRDKVAVLKLTDKFENSFQPDTRIVTVDEVGTQPEAEHYTRFIKLINSTEEKVDHSESDKKQKIAMRHKATLFTSNYSMGFLKDPCVTHKVSEGAPLRRLDIMAVAAPTDESREQAGLPFSVDLCVDENGKVRDDALQWFIGKPQVLATTDEMITTYGMVRVLGDEPTLKWAVYANEDSFAFVNSERYKYHAICNYLPKAKGIKTSSDAYTFITKNLQSRYMTREVLARTKISESKCDVCRECGNYQNRDCKCIKDVKNEAFVDQTALRIYDLMSNWRDGLTNRVTMLITCTEIRRYFTRILPCLAMCSFVVSILSNRIMWSISSISPYSFEGLYFSIMTFPAIYGTSFLFVMMGWFYLVSRRIRRMNSWEYCRYVCKPVADQVMAYKGTIMLCFLPFLASKLFNSFVTKKYENEYLTNPFVSRETVQEDIQEKKAWRFPQTGKSVHDPNYIRINTKTSKNSETTPPKQLLSMIKKNIQIFHINKIPVGFAFPTSAGFLVRAHFFSGLPDIIDVGLTSVGLTRGLRENKGISIKKNVTTIPDSDFALITSRGFGSLPAMEKYFVEDNSSWTSGFVYHMNPDSLQALNFNEILCKVTQGKCKITNNECKSALEGIMTNPTFAGMCGIPIIDSSVGIVRGFHMAGSRRDKSKGQFVAEPISMEIYNKLVDQSKVYQPAPDAGPCLSGAGIITQTPKMITEDCSDPKVNVRPENLTVEYEGSLETGAAYNRPGYRHSKYYDQVVKHFGPAPTENPYRINDIKHRKKHVAKVSDRKDLDDLELARKCMLNYIKPIIAHIRSLPEEDRIKRSAVMSLEEALNGIPGDMLASVDVKTAAGHPWGGKKLGCLVCDEQGEPIRPLQLKPEYEAQVLEAFEQITVYGATLGTVFNASIKVDETLPPDKQKARVFSAGPFLDFILARMLLGHLLLYVRTFPEIFETGLGVDMESLQGKMLFEHLRPEEDWPDSNHCFDYSSFDTSNSSSLSSIMDEGFLMLLKEFGCGESHLRGANALLTGWSYPRYNHAGDILKCSSSNPSGNFFTTVKNGGHNSIYIRYAFYKLHPHLDPLEHDFRAEIRLVTFGDDNAMRVSPAYNPTFTGPKIEKTLGDNGIVVTSADKRSQIRDFVPYEDLNFLSQSPIYHETLGWIPTMDETSLNKSLYHVKVKCKDDFVQLFDNASWKLDRYVSKGTQAYDKAKKQLEDLFEDIDEGEVAFESYDEAYKRLAPKYYENHISNIDRAKVINWNLEDKNDPLVKLSRTIADDYFNEGKQKVQPWTLKGVAKGTAYFVVFLLAYIYLLSFIEYEIRSSEKLPERVFKECKRHIKTFMSDSAFWIKIARTGYSQEGIIGAIKEVMRAREETPLYMYMEYENEGIPITHPTVLRTMGNLPRVIVTVFNIAIMLTIFDMIYNVGKEIWIILGFLFRTDFQSYSDRARKLISMAPAVYAGRLDAMILDGEHLSYSTYADYIDSIIGRLKLYTYGWTRTSAERQLDQLSKIQMKLKLVNFDGSLKRQAFGIVIQGPPGSGKSGLAAQLYQQCFDALGTGIKKSEVVVLNDEDEYDSELRSDHKVIILDDKAAVNYSVIGRCPWDDTLRYCNNTPQCALNPNLDSKGIIRIQPELVIITTNRYFLVADDIRAGARQAPHFGSSDGFMCPSALQRRFPIVITMSLDHSWFLWKYKEPSPNGNALAFDCKVAYDRFSQEEAIAIIREEFLKHYHHQDDFIKGINSKFSDYENEGVPLETYMRDPECRELIMNGDFELLPEVPLWFSILWDLFFGLEDEEEIEYENEGIALPNFTTMRKCCDEIGEARCENESIEITDCGLLFVATMIALWLLPKLVNWYIQKSIGRMLDSFTDNPYENEGVIMSKFRKSNSHKEEDGDIDLLDMENFQPIIEPINVSRIESIYETKVILDHLAKKEKLDFVYQDQLPQQYQKEMAAQAEAFKMLEARDFELKLRETELCGHSIDLLFYKPDQKLFLIVECKHKGRPKTLEQAYVRYKTFSQIIGYKFIALAYLNSNKTFWIAGSQVSIRQHLPELNFNYIDPTS